MMDISSTNGNTPTSSVGVVTSFDDSLFLASSEKAYTVKAVIMVEVDLIANDSTLGDSVKDALSNLSLGNNTQIVGSRFDITPLDLGEHVN